MDTPAYMAPEQTRGEPGDERSDVYELGARPYPVLSGRSPYRDTRSADIVRAVVEGPPPALATVVPGVAVDLIAVVTARHGPRSLRSGCPRRVPSPTNSAATSRATWCSPIATPPSSARIVAAASSCHLATVVNIA